MSNKEPPPPVDIRTFQKRGHDRRRQNRIPHLHAQIAPLEVEGSIESEKSLARALCDYASADYPQVLVGYIDHERPSFLRIIVHRGFEKHFPSRTEYRIKLDGGAGEGKNPFGECLCTKQPAVVNLYAAENMSHIWRRAGLTLGFETIIAVPILVDSEAIGLMAFFSGSSGQVDPQELSYLQKLVDELTSLIRITRGRRREQELVHLLTVETERRRHLEQQLADARHMEAIGRLAGGVAHDLINKLAVINSSLEMLEAWLSDSVRERDRVRASLRATKVASDLVLSLLAFVRRQPLVPKVIDVPAALSEIKTLLTGVLPARIELMCNISPDTWRVSVDPAGFEAAIMNLLKNAQDAVSEGGRITIVTKNIEAIGYPDNAEKATEGGYTCIEVTDNGCGIAADILPRVFEPFFTTKEPSRGTGLGLASVYSFARQSGGVLKIRSQAGTGTTLSLYLPRAED